MLPRFLSILLLGLVIFRSAPLHGQEPAAAPKPAATETNYRYWNTDWSFDQIRIGQLLGRLESLGIELPVELDGRATVRFSVGIPWNAPRTGKAYRFEGSLEIRDFVSDELQFEVVRADVSYRDGKLTLTQLRCAEKLNPLGEADERFGSLTGNASAELIPSGRFDAKIKTQKLRLGPIAQVLSEFGLTDNERPLVGSLDSDVQASGDVDQLDDPSGWTIEGSVVGRGFQRGDSIRFDVTANELRSERGKINVGDFRVSSEQRPDFFVTGDAEIRLDPATEFDVNLSANDVSLPEWAAVISKPWQSMVDGKVDLKGNVSGRLSRSSTVEAMDIQLALASPSVRVAALDLGVIEHDLQITRDHVSLKLRHQTSPGDASRLVIRSLETDYQITDDAATIKNLTANLFSGTISGEGQLARRNELSHEAKLVWDQLDPQFVLPIELANGRPVVSLLTGGRLNWSVPAASVGQPAEHRVDAEFRVDPFAINGQVVGGLDARVRLENRSLDAGITGTLLGGTANIQAVADLEDAVGWKTLGERLRFSQFTVQGCSLRELTNAVGLRNRRFEARIGGSIEPQLQTEGKFSGTAKLEWTGLTVDGTLVSRSLVTESEFGPDHWSVLSVRGDYAGGRLEADGRWVLGAGEKVMRARLTRADGQRMLLPISSEAETWIGGRVSGDATVVGQGDTIGTPIRIRGRVGTESATAFGIPVGKAHSPFEVRFQVDPLLWQASFPKIRSNLARGRVSGDLAFRSAGAGRSGFHLDSDWRINHVDFESLIASTIGTSTIGRGDLTGDFRLQGRHIRGAKDLDGQFSVRLGGTDATAVPGLSAAGALLGATSLVGVRFEQGEAVGRIARGRLFLDRVVMTSDRVSVSAEGNVGLLDRRMDVDAVISTGNFQGQNSLLQGLGTQALLDTVPIGSVNRVLSDRTIVIKMVGATRDPVIRLLPGETLRLTARRFATQELFGLIIADSLLLD